RSDGSSRGAIAAAARSTKPVHSASNGTPAGAPWSDGKESIEARHAVAIEHAQSRVARLPPHAQRRQVIAVGPELVEDEMTDARFDLRRRDLGVRAPEQEPERRDLKLALDPVVDVGVDAQRLLVRDPLEIVEVVRPVEVADQIGGEHGAAARVEL